LDYGGHWRASATIDGSPGEVDPTPPDKVVVNELMAHTDYSNPLHPEYDSNDWIELLNSGASTVSLAGWYLSDQASDLKKWAIPGAATIGPGSRITFDEVSGFHSPITNGFGLNKAGEQVFLSYLPGTSEDRVVDCVRFKGQESGTALGRYPDGGDWWYALAPTTNAPNAVPTADVIVSEIMYHPQPTPDNPEDNDNDEYVEILNTGGVAVDLWNASGTWRIDGGVEYTFPPNTTLGAGGALVVVSFDPADPDAMREFRNAYGVTNGEVTILGPWSGRLSNRGERVALERPQAPDAPGDDVSWVIVDEAIYFDRDPWPAETDGTGRPLERVVADRSGNNPANWRAGFWSSPGFETPGFRIDTPAYGETVLLGSTVPLSVAIDASSVSGSVHQVEFVLDGSSICVTAAPPYRCSLGPMTNTGLHTVLAMLTDDGGVHTSRQVVVNVAVVDNGAGATSVGITGATLNGSLSNDGSADITIYWGAGDGGTNKTAWSNSVVLGRQTGSFSGSVTGLVASGTHYYRCYASNAYGHAWAASATSFVTYPPGVSLTLAGSPFMENGGTATVSAVVSSISASNVAVGLVFAGDAIPAGDYLSSATSVTVSAGSPSGSITLTGQNDSEVEPPESIIVAIDSIANGTTCSPHTVTAQIISDDPRIINTGASNVTDSTATLGGNLTHGSSSPVTIFWGPTDGETNASAWAGTNSLGTLNEGPFADTLTGLLANRTYYYRCYASNAEGDAWAATSVAFATDPPAVSVGDVTTSEGDSGSRDAVFTVSLSAASAVPVSVNYSTADGTALSPADYASTSGLLVVAPGLSSGEIAVPVVGDAIDEWPSEDFFVNVSNPTNCVIADAQGVGTIADDDVDVTLIYWPYKMKITFSGYDKDEALSDFPALVTFDTNLVNFAYSQFDVGGNPDDPWSSLRFANSNVTALLNYEVEDWNTNGRSAVWVQVPELDGTNCHIWAYWGNPDATNTPAYATNGAAWSAGYKGVWHMHQADATDSTAARHHGTAHGSVTPVSDGLIAGANDFDADADYIAVPDSDDFTLSGDYSLSAWIRSDAIGNQNEGFVGTYTGGSRGFIFALQNNGANTLRCWAGGTWRSSDTGVAEGEWKHVVYTRGDSQGRFYIDGRLVRSRGDAVAGSNGGQLHLGGAGTSWGSNRFDGRLDEVRVAGMMRSSNWVWACWFNQISNDVFTTFGDVQAADTSVPSMFVVYGATNVVDTSAHLTARLTSEGTAPASVWVYWGTADGGQIVSNWANTNAFGPVTQPPDVDYSHAATGLAANTHYYYAYRAANSNGATWAASSFSTVGPPAPHNSGGATNLGIGTATLQGSLTNASPASVTVYWGPVDGGTDASAWATSAVIGQVAGNASFATNVSGLLYGIRYTYRCYATNAYGDKWADPTDFTSSAAGEPYAPGLIAGSVSGNINTTTPNPGTATNMGPELAKSSSKPPWADNTTFIYSGEMYFNGGSHHFIESIDDRVWLEIDGTVVMNNGSWNDVSGSPLLQKPPGWYPFELRMSNGGGGAGRVQINPGFQYNTNGVDTLADGDHWYPEDDGAMSLFRHASSNAADFLTVGIENTGASNVTAGAAELTGLLSASGAVFHVWLHWGTSNAGTNDTWDHSVFMGAYTNVPEVSFSHAVSGLAPETAFYYTYRASNAVANTWAQPAVAFATAADLTQWSRQARITFAGYDSGETLHDFPLLVVFSTNITGFSYDQVASPDGHDLRFADSGGEMLAYEIESWDTNGRSLVWVRIPELEATGTDSVWAYWGNGGASRPAYTTNGAVWTANYNGVWHMVHADARDSTAAGHHGTAQGSVTPVTGGPLGPANDFDADVDYIAVPDSDDFTLAADYSVSAWIDSDSLGDDEGFVGTHDGDGFIFALQNDGNNTLRFWANSNWRSSDAAIADGQWKYVVYARSGTRGRFYIDGGLVRTRTDAIAGDDGGELHLGAGGTSWGGDRFDGTLDEVRISAAERSADWVRACWLSQASNESFNAFGDVEPVNPYVPRIHNALGAADVTSTSAWIRATLTSTGTAPTEVWCYWGTADAGTNLTWAFANAFGVNAAPPPVVYSNRVDSLTPGTVYYYTYRAANSNGTRWAKPSASFKTIGLPEVNNGSGAVPERGSAVLTGQLTAGTEADVTIYWGASDGGTNAFDWAFTNVIGHLAEGVSFSTGTTTGLLYGLQYYYRCYASNEAGEAWANSTTGFVTRVPMPRQNGLIARAYDTIQGDTYLDPISNLDARTPDGTYTFTGVVDYGNFTPMAVDYPALTDGNTITLSWRGYFVAEAGTYTFGTQSDDGSVVYMDLNEDGDFADPGEMVVDNKGLHGMRDRTGEVTPGAGDIPIAIAFYENGGGEGMRARWKKGGGLAFGSLDVLDCDSGDFLTGFGPPVVAIENHPPTNITASSATWKASLAAQGTVFDVRVYWGTANGGTNANTWANTNWIGAYTNVAHADLTHNAAGLAPDTTYFYTFAASNAATNLWASPSRSFATMGALVVSNAAPTGIVQTAATLNGRVASGGSGEAFIYWGPLDGGTNKASWANPVALGTVLTPADLSAGATGLLAGKPYFYRCYATNAGGDGWAAESVEFTTAVAQVSVDDVAVAEGDAGTVDAAFTITLSATSGPPVSLSYETSNGTAEAGADYTAAGGTLVIPSGATSTQVTVSVHGDGVGEYPSESFTLQLSAPVNCELADASGSCTIIDDELAATLDRWGYWMKVSFTGYNGTRTLMNFPALVRLDESLDGFLYSCFDSATGDDLRFANAGRTELLNHEIEEWDTNGESTVWVQLPRLPPGGTSIWAYWGEPGVSAPASTTNGAVWSAGYRGVWHLKEEQAGTSANGLYVDSTANDNDGNDRVSHTDQGGVINGGQRFDGNDYVDCGNAAGMNFNTATAITVSAWIKSAAGANGHIVNTGGGWGESGYSMWWYNGRIRVEMNPSGGYYDNTAPSAGEWHHLAVTWDDAGDNVWRTYIDGAQAPTTRSFNGPIGANHHNLNIGRNASRGHYFNGHIDEVRLSDKARSADWIRASYSNQVSGSAFVTFDRAIWKPRASVFMLR